MRKLILLGIFIAGTAFAGTAFYKGERIDGLHKICYYDYLGDTVAITVKSHEVCPVTIQVD